MYKSNVVDHWGQKIVTLQIWLVLCIYFRYDF